MCKYTSIHSEKQGHICNFLYGNLFFAIYSLSVNYKKIVLAFSLAYYSVLATEYYLLYT
jgi:hypothetical protein